MVQFAGQQDTSPEDLGDTLAHLVWESFTDLVSELEETEVLEARGIGGIDENPRVPEETLILIMWAHTRGAELALAGRIPDPLLRETLDRMHAAVFDDMVDQGTPESELPVFEQRVGARYTEYNAASERSVAAVGDAAVSHLFPGSEGEASDTLAVVLSQRVLEVTDPLRDYLEEVSFAG